MTVLHDSLAFLTSIGIRAAFSIIVVTSLIIYVVARLYFHPLSKFKGPKIAALTRWYEFYHDVIRDGTYVKYYPELHQKYGMTSVAARFAETSLNNVLRPCRTNCSKPRPCE